MKRVLSGIQPSGKPHLGNYFGAMRQHIEMQKDFECFLFIADLHALTTVKDPQKMREQTFDLAASYLALGLDPEKTVFFKHSDLPELPELCWIFNCITQMSFLERAHAWKDAKAKGKKETTVGLFTYPMLQAADILIYQPDLIPVGQDQKQHVEMARDIGQNFNNTFGETFKIPDAYIKEDVAVVPGTDGQKMSKSYGNTIDIFADESAIKKQVMGIVTDSTPMEDSKDPAKCNVFKLYRLLATKEDQKELADKYKKGGFGYRDAKKLLLNKILEHFAKAREKYQTLLPKKKFVYDVLNEGAKKARKVASETLNQTKIKIGYK